MPEQDNQKRPVKDKPAQPEVAEMSIELLRRLKFHGICGTEFKKDPRDGRFKMMEINLRPTLWFSIIEASGIEVIYAIYQDLIGSSFLQSGCQSNGVKWIYTARDLVSSLYYLLQGDLTPGTWLRSLRGKKAHAIFARDDFRVMVPLPFCLAKEFWQYFLGGG